MPLVAPLLGAGVPLVLYVWSLSAYAYWLDSVEFTAATIWLDIAHPPGHPLTCLWGKLFCLLPVGSLPFRVALGQAVAATLALVSLQTAITRSLRHLGVAGRWSVEATAIGTTWIVAASFAFWFQAVRAEVYALQAMVVCFALERVVALACRAVPDDPRPLFLAAFALGLGLSNHHLIAVLALPALLVELARLMARQGIRPLVLGALSGLVGLSTYVYLPMRALTEPRLDLGHPATAENAAWVMSALIFSRTFTNDVAQTLGERFADLTVLLIENFGMLVPAFALLGLYALARGRATWSLAYAWGSAALVGMGVRTWLGSVRGNPDTLGYLMPSFAAFAALSACGVGVLIRELEAARFRAGRGAASWIALLPLALGALRLAHGWPEGSLAHFRAPHLFDLQNERSLPPRALLIATTPTLSFRHWEALAVDATRADVTLLPMPFVNYPDKARLLMAHTPELAPLIAGARGKDVIPHDALEALARVRPVLVELDARVALPVMSRLLPEGLLYRVVPTTPTDAELARAVRARERALDALTTALGPERRERETARQLLWTHYLDALYLAHHGAREAALRAVARGLAVQPLAIELKRLRTALLARKEGQGLDIQPFVARH